MDLGKTFQSASYTWRSLLEGYRMLKKRLTLDVGDGGVIRFSLDSWLEEANLVELCLAEVPIGELSNRWQLI